MKELLPFARASITRDANRRAASRPSDKEARARQAMDALAEVAAATDANTARLRALRLEKERQEAEAAAASGVAPVLAVKKKPVRRITCG